MKKTLLLLTLVLAMSSIGWAGACASGTLADYTGAGFSCTIGDKTFSGFTYTGSGFGGATAIPADGVAVVPEIVGSEIGFLFSAAWSVGAGQGLDSLIGYTVTAAPGWLISDAVLTMGGAAFSGTGIAAVAENLSNGTDLNVVTHSGGTTPGLKSSANFAGVPSLDVHFKDVSVNGHSSGSAQISAVENRFSQTPIPEPATILIFGSGLLALGGYIRRRKS